MVLNRRYGLYEILMQSRKPIAKHIRKQCEVFEEEKFEDEITITICSTRYVL